MAGQHKTAQRRRCQAQNEYYIGHEIVSLDVSRTLNLNLPISDWHIYARPVNGQWATHCARDVFIVLA